MHALINLVVYIHISWLWWTLWPPSDFDVALTPEDYQLKCCRWPVACIRIICLFLFLYRSCHSISLSLAFPSLSLSFLFLSLYLFSLLRWLALSRSLALTLCHTLSLSLRYVVLVSQGTALSHQLEKTDRR